MSKRRITPKTESEVRRLVTRFSIERVAAGWSVTDLSKVTGVFRSNIDRTENGETIPTLPVLIQLAEPMGLRLDWVPEHLRPFLELDEPEVAALVKLAESDSGEHGLMSPYEKAALGRVRRKLLGAAEGGETDDADR